MTREYVTRSPLWHLWLGIGARTQVMAFIIFAVLLAAGASARAGEALDLAPYRGKIVVVDFWASWCAPCRQSFPWLNTLQQRYGAEGLVIVGVNVDRERAQADRFLREVPAEFSIIYDPAGTLAEKYELMGMPSSFVFGPNGELLSTHIGFKNGARAERETELAALLHQYVTTTAR